MHKKPPRLRMCSTVGGLISQLEKLPKRTKLSEPLRPVQYNTGITAKSMGLLPEVGLRDY